MLPDKITAKILGWPQTYSVSHTCHQQWIKIAEDEIYRMKQDIQETKAQRKITPVTYWKNEKKKKEKKKEEEKNYVRENTSKDW